MQNVRYLSVTQPGFPYCAISSTLIASFYHNCISFVYRGDQAASALFRGRNFSMNIFTIKDLQSRILKSKFYK